MKKTFVLAIISLFICQSVFASNSKQFKSSGQVITVDPVYSQITIRHDAIKGFAQDGLTEFYSETADMLKNIHTRDLVDFEFTDNKGDVKITKITKTGEAPPDEPAPFGQAVQETLEGAGSLVKGVTEPIAPINAVAGGVADATTGATGAVLNDVPSEHKANF